MPLAACSGSGGSGGGDSVTIGYQNNGSVDPAQASLSLGLYEEYIDGEVNLVHFDSGPASLTALGSGDVDIMTGIGNPPVASAISNNVPVSVIWAEELGQSDQALVVKKESGIDSVSDLAGKNVAVVVGSTSAMALNATLDKNGMSNSDITIKNMAPNTMRSAWSKNEISAAYVWHPVLGKLLNDGGVNLTEIKDVSEVAPVYNFSVVNKNWATEHPDQIRQFIKAQDEGLEQLKNDRSATLKEMIKDTNETMEEAKVASKSTKMFAATEQLEADALGTNDENSLALTSLVAASKYLNSVDPSVAVLKQSDISIDRSFVKDYLKEQGTS